MIRFGFFYNLVGQTATINVSGSNLPSTIVASITAQKVDCTRTKVTATAATFTCPLDAAGNQTLSIKTNTQANGGVAITGGTATFTVSSALAAPTNFKATPGDGKVTLSWNAVTGATGYNVCQAKVSITDIANCTAYAGGAWTGTNTPNLVITGLTNDTKHYFRVMAEDSNGNKSPASTEVIATPTASTGDDVWTDDFNDGLDDLSKWDFSRTAHTEKDGYLQLRMDQTDTGGSIHLSQFSPQNHIKVEIRHFMHQGSSDYYFPFLSLAGKDEKFSVGVSWRKSAYSPDNWCAGYNQPELSSYDVTLKKSVCIQPGISLISSNYYERWITTVMEYDADTGIVTVDFDNDGMVELSGIVDASVRTPIEGVWIGTYGWWTGHSHSLDYIQLTGKSISFSDGWIRNPSNGHDYKVIDNCGTWKQCETAAQAVGAHLVVLDNQIENDWVINSFNVTKTISGYWIGYTDEEQEGLWKTVTGGIPTYTNWDPREPNNDGGRGNYVQMVGSVYDPLSNYGQWNDLAGDNYGGWVGYSDSAIIERTTPTSNANPFEVRGNDEVGATFTVPTGKTQCTFGAIGDWSTQADKSPVDANGEEGVYLLRAKLPSAQVGSLIMQRANQSYELIGTSSLKTFLSNETVKFMMNDVSFAYGTNLGSQWVSWSCQ